MKIAGALIIILALIIGAVPQFTDCASQGRSLTLDSGRTIPMKCHWTAEAELATAGPLAVMGGLMFINRRKETYRAIAILGAVMGAFAILLPTQLIGVCMSDEMLCNTLMKPALILSGALTIVISAVVFFLAKDQERKEVPET